MLRPFAAEWTTLAAGGRGRAAVVDQGALNWYPPESAGEVAGAAETPAAEAPADAAPAENAAAESAAAEATVAENSAAEGAVAEEAPATLAESITAAGVGLKDGVSLAVPSDQVLLRVVRLPSASREELRGMVDLQVDKFSPFPVESLSVDFEILGEDDDGLLVLIGAVREAVANGLRDDLTAAGLHPERVDVEAMGWWDVLCRREREPSESVEILLLMTAPVQIIATRDGVPLAFRSLPLPEDSSPADTVQLLAEEIDYTVMALELEHGSAGQAAVEIWQDDGDTLDAEALAGACGYGVSLHELKELESVSRGVAQRALAADRPRLDLTPAAWRQAEEAERFKRRMLMAGGASLALWLLLVGALGGAFVMRRSAHAATVRDRDQWMQQALEIREMRRRAFTLSKYTNQTHSALECLREIAVAQADGVELRTFSYRKGEAIRLTGSAKAVNQIYAFKRRLDQSNLFIAPELDNIRNNPRQDVEMFDVAIPLPEEES